MSVGTWTLNKVLWITAGLTAVLALALLLVTVTGAFATTSPADSDDAGSVAMAESPSDGGKADLEGAAERAESTVDDCAAPLGEVAASAMPVQLSSTLAVLAPASDSGPCR